MRFFILALPLLSTAVSAALDKTTWEFKVFTDGHERCHGEEAFSWVDKKEIQKCTKFDYVKKLSYVSTGVMNNYDLVVYFSEDCSGAPYSLVHNSQCVSSADLAEKWDTKDNGIKAFKVCC